MDEYSYYQPGYRYHLNQDMIGLHVDSVVKHFGLRLILNDVFVSCQPGEIIGLLGRNGSGKSSLLQIIFGSLNAENKFVKIGEKHIHSLSDNRDLLHYLPQDNFLPSHVKIKNIISSFCIRPKALLLFENDFIKPLLNKKSGQLSGGERRIIEIYLLVYSEASYLLFDEPFNGIAPLHKEMIKDLIKEHSHHKGFIVTDHDYRNILDISTSVILIHDGNTKRINERQELIDWGYLPESADINHLT